MSVKFNSQVRRDVELPYQNFSDFRAGLRMLFEIVEEFEVKVFDEDTWDWVPLTSLENIGPKSKILVEILNLSFWGWQVDGQ